MGKKEVGLYLGVDSVGVAVAQAKKILFLANFTFSSLEEAKSETQKEDIYWEALINKALREAGAESGNIYVSLADRDFIFRSLEMPLMKRNEVKSSLMYEIEKYIPFKVDELEWDYEQVSFPKERKMNISFVGMRENNLNRIRDILSRLKVNTTIIEPSSLSLVRLVKSVKQFSKLRNFALLDFTESESYLTFFQNDLPVFNRYLNIPKKEDTFDINKFVESVDFSFQYFKREFKAYSLEKFIVVGDMKEGNLPSLLEEGLQVKVEMVSPYELTARNNASVESAKALGVATRDYYPSSFKPVLKKTALPAEGMPEIPLEAPPLRTGLMLVLLGIGLVITFFLSVIMGNEVGIRKLALEREEKNINVNVPEELKEFSWEKRAEIVGTKAVQIGELKKIKSSFQDLSGVLDRLNSREVLPQGMWFESIEFSRELEGYGEENKPGKYIGRITGYIFRNDDYAEREGLNEFISNLKKQESISSFFSVIEIDFSRRQKMREFDVTYFGIRLR